MKMILLQADESIGELDLSQGAYTIGRGEDCSVVVDDPSLAETNARILEEDGTAYVEPVSGETKVNGTTVSARTALTDSDQLSFGSIELSVSVPSIPPTLSEAVTESVIPAVSNDDKAPTEKAGARIGKGLLGLAKASAREAGRGAKLAGLRAQIEKLRRINLHSAYLALGRKAYDSGVMGDKFVDQYAQVRDIEAEITKKRQGTAAEADAGVVAKAKAKTVTAKMRAQAELRERKRNSMLVDVGRQISESSPEQAEITPELEAAASVLQRIEELQGLYDIAATDHAARDELTASAKSIRSARTRQVPPVPDVAGTPVKKRSRLAVVSCAIGIVSLPLAMMHMSGVISACVAIALGVASLIQISKNRAMLRGMRFGLVGVATGCLVVCFALIATMIGGMVAEGGAMAFDDVLRRAADDAHGESQSGRSMNLVWRVATSEIAGHLDDQQLAVMGDFTAFSGHDWFAARVRLTNTGDTPIAVAPNKMSVHWQGKAYDVHRCGVGDALQPGTIAPRRSVEGLVTFMAPANLGRGSTMTYDDSSINMTYRD